MGPWLIGFGFLLLNLLATSNAQLGRKYADHAAHRDYWYQTHEQYLENDESERVDELEKLSLAAHYVDANVVRYKTEMTAALTELQKHYHAVTDELTALKNAITDAEKATIAHLKQRMQTIKGAYDKQMLDIKKINTIITETIAAVQTSTQTLKDNLSDKVSATQVNEAYQTFQELIFNETEAINGSIADEEEKLKQTMDGVMKDLGLSAGLMDKAKGGQDENGKALTEAREATALVDRQRTNLLLLALILSIILITCLVALILYLFVNFGEKLMKKKGDPEHKQSGDLGGKKKSMPEIRAEPGTKTAKKAAPPSPKGKVKGAVKSKSKSKLKSKAKKSVKGKSKGPPRKSPKSLVSHTTGASQATQPTKTRSMITDG